MVDEIEYIKRKKFIEYMNKMLKSQEPNVKKPSEVDVLEKLKGFLLPDAYKYLVKIRDRDENHFNRVIQALVYMMLNGYINIPVKKEDVLVIDKKLSGYKGKIYVERRGEIKEFNKAFREDEA